MKKPLPESNELKEKKNKARAILARAFREVHNMGLWTVCFDVKWNERMGPGSVSVITPEEWEHGTWLG